MCFSSPPKKKLICSETDFSIFMTALSNILMNWLEKCDRTCEVCKLKNTPTLKKKRDARKKKWSKWLCERAQSKNKIGAKSLCRELIWDKFERGNFKVKGNPKRIVKKKITIKVRLQAILTWFSWWAIGPKLYHPNAHVDSFNLLNMIRF